MMKKLALLLLAAAWAVAGFAQDRLYADEFPLGDVKLYRPEIVYQTTSNSFILWF